MSNLKIEGHKEEWDFYMLNVDDHIASMYLDLGLKAVSPITNLENIFWVSIRMNNPRQDGLSSEEESETLWDIEDLIVESICSKHTALFVGRLTNMGHRDIYFYFQEDDLLDKTLSDCMDKFPDYNYESGVKPDAQWEVYKNFIYPSPRSFQSISNRRGLEVMEDKGDELNSEREISHWIYFKTASERSQFEKEVLNKGFTIVDQQTLSSEDDFNYQLVILRMDLLSRNEIDNYTIDLWEFARKLNGNYDGWEAPLVIQE